MVEGLMGNEERWLYYADALPEYATKLVAIDVGDGKAERYTAQNGWADADGVQSEVKWTGDWDPIRDDDIDTSSRTSTIRNQLNRGRIGNRHYNSGCGSLPAWTQSKPV
jgi:hypothetical protein